MTEAKKKWSIKSSIAKGKKTTKTVTNANKALPKEKKSFLAPFIREGLLYGLVVLAVYVFLSLISYSPTDPGWTHTKTHQEISNLGGEVGAYTSDILLHLFGRVAYLFPILLLIVVLKLYRKDPLSDEQALTKILVYLGAFFLVVASCGLENLHFVPHSEQTFLPGGVLGQGTAQMTKAFGFVGSTALLLVLFGVSFSWFTRVAWLTVFEFTGKYVTLTLTWLWHQVQVYKDRKIGTKAKEERHESIKKFQDKAIDSEPLKIDIKPKDEYKPQSDRVIQEKQKPLFKPKEMVQKKSTSRVLNAMPGVLPPLSLLDEVPEQESGYSKEVLEALSTLVEKKLLDFNIEVKVVEVLPGPVITRFEINPAAGVKASQITNLANDLARSMSVISVRVVENIPGKPYMGIEIPNEVRETVYMAEGLCTVEYDKMSSPLTLLLGKDISGEPVVVDLAKMPHLLIAGTTGSGKSVCVNALIVSMLYKASPDDVRMIMIDPKMLELSIYEGIPHLLAPVVTDMEKASNALRWAIYEMERRYKLMASVNVRNLAGYNKKVKQGIEAGEPLTDPNAADSENPPELEHLPHIVIIIDELADLMMVVGKKIEELITRIAQKARAAGIHMILATQRPSVDVITGLIKANVPSRIAFQVSSKIDSRTVLDQMGAEQLLGHGDMLYLPPGTSMPIRVHGSFVDDHEVQNIVDFLKENNESEYNDEVLEMSQIAGEKGVTSAASASDSPGGEDDMLYDEAVKFVTERQVASISSVQRQFRIGYNRAARLIETMESEGVIGPPESGGRRKILAPPPPDAN